MESGGPFFAHWEQYKLHYVVVVIVLGILLYTVFAIQNTELRTDGVRSSEDGNGELYALGRGDASEDTQTILNRITWAASLHKRINLWARVFLQTTFVVLLIILLIFRRLPKPQEIVITYFCVFVPIFSLENFMHTHGDVYNDYNIRANAQILRDRFDLTKAVPPEPVNDPPDRPFVWLQ